MNIRQQKYKKNRIAGMNMYNAARAAGYSHYTAIKATENLEPKVTSLHNYLEQEGLTNKRLAKFLSEMLEATKVIGYLHQYKKGENRRIEGASPDEVISNEFLDIPDNAVRLKAMELICKIKGLIQTGSNVNVDVGVGVTVMPVIKVGQDKPLEFDLDTSRNP